VHVRELLRTHSPPFAQHVITKSQKKSEKLRAVVSDARELAALDKRISEEITKNCYLQRELYILKQERTRETWLLKNDLKNMEKVSHPIYKNINRAIIYAPGSSHAYIQQIIKISQHMSRIILI
jgi:predicted  nucleic acid-binding Zn-ribbon protein